MEHLTLEIILKHLGLTEAEWYSLSRTTRDEYIKRVKVSLKRKGKADGTPNKY